MDQAPEPATVETVVPTRPPTVPAAAIWLAAQELWELAERSPTGEKQGELRQWRPDGTLYLRGRTEAGQLTGAFATYHPNGQVAREGRYAAGELDGFISSYRSDGETPEALRRCCVPDTAWEMRSRYVGGQLHHETFFDRAGRALLSDGTLRPARPAGLPETAEFDEYAGRWGAGAADGNGSWVGPWRFWTVEGRLEEEAEYGAGRSGSQKISSRLFDAAGRVRHEISYEGEAVQHGPYRRRFVEAGESPYADARIEEERGAFEHGHAVGRWTLLDGAGATVRTLELGPAVDGEGIEGREVFSDETRTAEAWDRLAQELRGRGHTREALCAAARAAARRGSAEGLRALLSEITAPLSEEANTRTLAGLTDEKGTVPRVLDALVGGADAASALRTLSSLLKGTAQGSADFIEAAILLAPERRMAYMTRALLRIELGDPEGARADADEVAPESSEAADFLRTYARLLFPPFSFWPSRELPVSTIEEMPDTPVQPLEAVQRTIQIYATRLALVRAALERRAPGASWLPPALPALLPDGPLSLGAFEAEIVDETDQGPESSTVRVDESLDLTRWSLPSLMRLARSQWSALCWLCWSAGLEEVALPAAIDPPANFAQAAGMSIARFWRAQDAVTTGGLRAMTSGVPGFVWEELDIEGIPRPFAEIAQEEYLEMRSVFLFLMSPENVSPFQADLRQG